MTTVHIHHTNGRTTFVQVEEEPEEAVRSVQTRIDHGVAIGFKRNGAEVIGIVNGDHVIDVVAALPSEASESAKRALAKRRERVERLDDGFPGCAA